MRGNLWSACPLLLLLAAGAAGAAASAADAAGGWQSCYNGTATAGIAVDRVSGEVYAVVDGSGIAKSVDHGRTFTMVNQTIVKSHAETGCGLSIDPEGGRVMCFMCYGDAGGSLDGGKTWFKSGMGHWNWGTVDWSDAQARTMIGDAHGDGAVYLSGDQGKSWSKITGAGGNHVGVADANTLLCGGDGGIFLSTAKGTAWQKVSELKPKGRTMRVFKGHCYWLTDAGVISSNDHGRTWARLGTEVDGCVGPFFGTDEHSMMVVGLSGFSITHDDGASWHNVATLPDNLRTGWSAPEGGAPRDYWFVQFGWDPRANIIYASSLHAPLVRLEMAPDKESLAVADKMIAQLEHITDHASPAYRTAALKLYLAAADFPLDPERTTKVQELTAMVKEDIDTRQLAVRTALEAWDATTFERILTDNRKPFAGTALAPWFAEAGLVGKAHLTSARLKRSAGGHPAAAATAATGKQFDELLAQLTIDEFKQAVGKLKDALSASP